MFALAVVGQFGLFPLRHTRRFGNLGHVGTWRMRGGVDIASRFGDRRGFVLSDIADSVSPREARGEPVLGVAVRRRLAWF